MYSLGSWILSTVRQIYKTQRGIKSRRGRPSLAEKNAQGEKKALSTFMGKTLWLSIDRKPCPGDAEARRVVFPNVLTERNRKLPCPGYTLRTVSLNFVIGAVNISVT